MAQRRMFSPDIVASDAFLDMPTTSRELYFQLGMYADDDGFVSPKRIMKLTGASEDDLKVLIAKRFVLPFETGVIVIKHWLIHNAIRKDRYKPTRYLDEKKTLVIKDNGSYTEVDKYIGQPNGNQMAPQDRLGQDRLGQDNIYSEQSSLTPSQEAREFFSKGDIAVNIFNSLIKKGVQKEQLQSEFRKFIAYWTEPNKSGTKQRWELEKTFDVKRRLGTWLTNAQKFNKDTSNKYQVGTVTI